MSKGRSDSPKRRKKHNRQDAESRRLNKIIYEEWRACLRKGPTDNDAVYAAVARRASVLIAQMDSLKPEAVKARVSHIGKRVSGGGIKRAAKAAHIDQVQMRFEGMEQFRGIYPSIRYRDPEHKEVQTVHYLDSFEWQRAAAAQLCGDQISADTKQYHALIAGNAFASKLAAIYGDLPLRKLLELWFGDQESRGASTH